MPGKKSAKSSLRKKERNWLTVSRSRSPWQERLGGITEAAGHIASASWSKEWWMLTPNSFSPLKSFLWFRPGTHGAGHVWRGLLASANLTSKPPQRQTQRFVATVTLNPIYLTIKTYYHTTHADCIDRHTFYARIQGPIHCRTCLWVQHFVRIF